MSLNTVAAVVVVLVLAETLTFARAFPGGGAASPGGVSRPALLLARVAMAPPPQAQISVVVSPADYGLTASQSVTLVATVVNDSSNHGVTWSVSGSGCSGTGCGTLSAITSTSVKYTAPTAGGVYLVTATSVADVTRSASATIGVTDLSGVFTYRNDHTRTSINNKEYTLTPSNVKASSFGKLFTCPVDGSVYAQPLWIANVPIGGGIHNVVIVATMHDSVYAFDADNGSGTTCTQYWKASLLPSGATPVPTADTGETGDILIEIGITSTPVIDSATNHLFVVSKTKESGQYYQRLHRLNLADGTETAGSPQVVSASVTGSGNGSSGNSLPYNALHQNQRPGLALVNGIVYMASGSHGDISPWHGWIIGYNASTLTLASAFCTTPNTTAGGIWMSGSAPVFDSSNNVFVISSNGTYDGNTEFGDSFLKLSTLSGLTVSDWFTPDNQDSLSANNIDLGQGGAVTLLDSVSGPNPHLIIGGGKGGVLYLINRDNMGHFHPNDNNQAVQTWSLGNIVSASGTFWQNTFYIGAANSPLQAYAFNTTTGLFNTSPTSQANVSIAFPGLAPAISASGTTNAILWVIDSSTSGTNGAATGPAVLYAYDPTNLANKLYDSTQAVSNRDQAGNAVKFAVPTVANGKVYVAGVGTLTAYGLLNLPPSAAIPTFSPAPGGYTTSQNVTLSDTTPGATIYYTLDGSPPTTASSIYSTPINISTTTTITAMAVAPGLNNSPTASGNYTIQAQGTGTITFVQGNYATPQSTSTTVSVTYTGAQMAGDLNVVVVGWNDSTAVVSSVVDTKGNNYTLAVGPTIVSGALSQGIYYLKNIPAAAAGTNTVTVAFNRAALDPDIRILEYSGADPNSPVEGTSASTGLSAASTATATTTNANDLLFAANIVQTLTTGPGTGFTSRMITSPDGDIAEDSQVAAAGSYNASASLNRAGQWIMQTVALCAPGCVPPPVDTTPPTAPSNLTGPGPAVQATQSYINTTALTTHTTPTFDSSGGDLIVVTASSHAGVTMTPSDSFNNTWISGAGPTNTSTGADLRSQVWYAKSPTVGPGHTFTLTLSAAQPLVISVFVVKGSNISAPIDAISTVGDDGGAQTLNVTSPNITTTIGNDLLIGFAKSSVSETWTSGSGYTAEPAASSNFLDAETELMAMPGTYNSTFTINAAATWQAAVVAVRPPVTAASASQINLSWTASTDNVAVTGYRILRCQGPGCTDFVHVTTITGTTYSDGGLSPSTSYSYKVQATDAAGNLSAYSNTVTAGTQAPQVVVPTVSNVSPNNGPVAGGTGVTITGTNFAAGATVMFGSAAATNVVVVNGTTITATTPAGSLGAVTVTVTVNGQSGSQTNGFTYIAPPTVSSVSPNSGSTAGGTAVTIMGTNFAAGATVMFGSAAATSVAVVNGTTITATTPAGSAGAVTVTVSNPGPQSGSLPNGFTYVVVPTVSSVSPNNGPVAGGTGVTITGTNFAAGATVMFGSAAATNVVVGSGGTQITATTPAGSAGAVAVTVTVNSQSGSLTNGFTYNSAVAISFGQVAAATPQSPTATVPVTFPGAQTAGDLNIVVVGWNDTTATVQSVKDSAGNTYSLAIAPTSGTALRQSIYYAANIVGGSNTVTVQFNQAAAYPDVRILEYRGVTTLDATAGASGNSATANSGPATTTAANELIFGADMVLTSTSAAGSGFTTRIITSQDGDIAEDKVVTAAGSNSATATLRSAGPWVMQMVTFK